jgi:hypothetical protein
MSWRFSDGSIKADDGSIICTPYPSIDPFYLSLIKRTPDAIGLTLEFCDLYPR